jgi:hypothetical protein
MEYWVHTPSVKMGWLEEWLEIEGFPTSNEAAIYRAISFRTDTDIDASNLNGYHSDYYSGVLRHVSKEQFDMMWDLYRNRE